MANPSMQYADDRNLAARQRFWAACGREPEFSVVEWALGLVDLNATAAADVLDIGCGNGNYETALANRGHDGRLVALDLSKGMLDRVVHGARVVADAQALPFGCSEFDVVLAPHMLYHVANVAMAASEARRVLRPGGVFVAVTNGQDNIRGLVDLIEAAVGTGWRMRRPDDHFNLDNGAAQLGNAFDAVRRVDAPSGTVVVTDLELLCGYIESIGDHYENDCGLAWPDVVDRAMTLAAGELDSGALRWTTHVGAFLCST